MKITRFEDIEAWKAARRLAHAVSQVTRFPRRIPDHDLVRQMRRCAVSIMANIVEGFDAGSRREFVRFLRIALRSGSELQSHLYVALDEGHLDSPAFDGLYSQVRAVKGMIGGFIRYLRKTC
jgi:four helix bundle protein